MIDKKIIFLRSQDPETDSRLQRYINILKESSIEYEIVGWNKNKEKKQYPNCVLYEKHAIIGGGFKNIFNLILWNFFIFKILIKKRNEIGYIHSVDFDSSIPALFYKLIFKTIFIIDIYDKYSDSRNLKGLFKKIVDYIEKHLCLKADRVILPDECRVKQLKLEELKNITILENVPLVNNTKYDVIDFNEPLILSYVGILEKKHRGLEDLIKVVLNSSRKIKLNIAGDGEIREFVNEIAEGSDRVNYYGRVDQIEALNIMNNSHVIIGMYYKTNLNHLFASPNKYFEHLFIGRALLTTRGTPPGDKVDKYKTGFVIDEGYVSIKELVDNIKMDIIDEKSNNAKSLWLDKFESYPSTLKNKYLMLFN